MYCAINEAWPTLQENFENDQKFDCKYIRDHLKSCTNCRNMILQEQFTTTPQTMTQILTPTPDIKQLMQPFQNALSSFPAIQNTITTSMNNPEVQDIIISYLIGVAVLALFTKSD